MHAKPQHLDINALAASMLGARATAPPPPMVIGRRGQATMKVLVIGEDQPGRAINGAPSQYHSARVLVPDMPGVNDTVVPMSEVSLAEGGRVALFPLVDKDSADAAIKSAKRKEYEEANPGKSAPAERVQRNRVGTVAVEAGSVFELEMFNKNFPDLLITNCLYTVSVAEMTGGGDYGVRIAPAAVTKIGLLVERPVNEQRRIMAMLMHAPQLNPPLVQPVYTGKLLTNEELAKLRAAACTPETRYMKSRALFLPLVQYNNTATAVSRWGRGRNGVFISEPALSLLNDDQWPGIKETNGVKKALGAIRFRVDVVQYTLRDPARPVRITASDEHAAVFVRKNIGCNVSMYEKAVVSLGVVDDRHWFNHGALRYLAVATPMLLPVYVLKGTHETQATDPPAFQLDFSVSTLGVTKTNAGALAFTFDGVVNAGYPVDKASALALLGALAAKEPMRYKKSMVLVPAARRKLTVLASDQPLPDHWMQFNETTLVCNLLEGFNDANEMDEAQWQFVVIPNMAPKCEVTRSLGWDCLNKLAAAHGGVDGAGRILGPAFVSLATNGYMRDADTPSEVINAFRPEVQRPFDFLLMGVSRAAIAESGVSLLCSRNHVAIMDAVAAEMYPTDLSDLSDIRDEDIDLAEVERAEAAAQAGRRADDDDREEAPASKRAAADDGERDGSPLPPFSIADATADDGADDDVDDDE